MNPIDVIRTKFYNQKYVNGKGELYSGAFDAAKKLYSREGPFGFYKGFTTHFLRIGPHFCCILVLNKVTFVFLGILRRKTNYMYQYLDQLDSFKQIDANHDGKLDQYDVMQTIRKILKGKETDDKKVYKTDSD
jgi:solute carrier family 25 protein 34/35